MRPARPSVQRKPQRRPVSRRSVVVSQRSTRSIWRRRPRQAGKTVSSGSFSSSIAAFFRLGAMIICIVGLLSVGGYILLKQVVLPSLVFSEEAVQIKVFTLADEPTKLLVLRVQPNWQDSQLYSITDVQATGLHHHHPERVLSQELGILVSQVESIPTAAVPQVSLWQRLSNIQTASGRAVEQLRLVEAMHTEVVPTETATEFREGRIVPVLNPSLGAVCPVAVRNTTQTAGMAEAASALLERSGLLVVRTASATDEKKETILRISAQVPQDCIEVASQLQQALVLQAREPEVDSQLEFDQFRAGMILELGEDWQTNTAE